MIGYIPKQERKTLLFLADDCRLPSGIGTMTRELIVGNAHIFNFVHVGAAINHPDVGKILDLSQEINKEVGIDDASVLIYPYNGYGDPDLIRTLMSRHKIDGIVHFTDPRYWIWLYQMSAELRQEVPIFYYHIWDDAPAPHYNKPFYQSCDLLMGISKQSDNLAKLVLGEGQYIELTPDTPSEKVAEPLPKVCYVPHGINTKYIYPVPRDHQSVREIRKQLFGADDPEFVLLYNNRNIRRKMTSDVVLAFSQFHDQLPPDQQQGVRLVLHTQPVDENGTDLIALIEDLFPHVKSKIVFTNARYSATDLNWLYNACDVVINIGSNEGWGLSSTEAMLAGVPVINNVTGGLQDQLRFEDDKGNWINFNAKFTSNHSGRVKAHGKWGKPVFPAAVNLQGSIPTPYIFDDRVNVLDVVEAIQYWHNMPRQQRIDCGLEGNRWAHSEEAGLTAVVMCDRFARAINQVLRNWVPPPRFKMYSVEEELKSMSNKQSGICLK